MVVEVEEGWTSDAKLVNASTRVGNLDLITAPINALLAERISRVQGANTSSNYSRYKGPSRVRGKDVLNIGYIRLYTHFRGRYSRVPGCFARFCQTKLPTWQGHCALERGYRAGSSVW